MPTPESFQLPTLEEVTQIVEEAAAKDKLSKEDLNLMETALTGRPPAEPDPRTITTIIGTTI